MFVLCRLFLARDSCPSTDGVFVLSELGAATELLCAAAVETSVGDTQVLCTYVTLMLRRAHSTVKLSYAVAHGSRSVVS